MNYTQIKSIFKRKKGLMVLAGLLLAAIVFWSAMLFAPKYQSNFDVLMIQNSEGFVDSYTLAKSTEHVSKLLSESVYAEVFLNKVIESYPDMAKILPIDKESRMKSWGKMVRTSPNAELGIIHFKVLSGNKSQAENISRTIAGVLANNNNLFVSANQRVEVRMLNTPVIKNNPGTAMLLFLVLMSFLVGMLVVFVFGFYKDAIGRKKSEDEVLTRDDEGNVIDAQSGEIVAYRQE